MKSAWITAVLHLVAAILRVFVGRSKPQCRWHIRGTTPRIRRLSRCSSKDMEGFVERAAKVECLCCQERMPVCLRTSDRHVNVISKSMYVSSLSIGLRSTIGIEKPASFTVEPLNKPDRVAASWSFRCVSASGSYGYNVGGGSVSSLNHVFMDL